MRTIMMLSANIWQCQWDGDQNWLNEERLGTWIIRDTIPGSCLSLYLHIVYQVTAFIYPHFTFPTYCFKGETNVSSGRT